MDHTIIIAFKNVRRVVSDRILAHCTKTFEIKQQIRFHTLVSLLIYLQVYVPSINFLFSWYIIVIKLLEELPRASQNYHW